MFLGIDPGILGSFSLYSIKEDFIIAQKIPYLKINGKKVIDATLLAGLISQLISDHNPKIYLEQVHAMPKNGAVSMFRFGEAYGIIKGILAALEVDWVDVTPRTWQKALLGPEAGNTKDRALTHILAHFEGKAPSWMIKKRGSVDEQYIDAMCIAKYGSLYG